jgi:amino acid adenylation domain-containing protein
MSYLLHQLLIEAAAAHPERVAVTCGAEAMRYGELDRQSNQLAWSLLAAGIERGERVGIYLPKSIASIVSLFGILKAGAAYVPLDPFAPVRRLAFILRDCGIQCVITTTGKMPAVVAMTGIGAPVDTLVLADQAGKTAGAVPSPLKGLSWGQVHHAESTMPAAALRPIEADLAYILYTSGSTGEPKGVMISHLAALTFIRWATDCFQVSDRDRLSNHAPLHFDLSVFDIFAALGTGAMLCLLPDGISAYPVRMAEFIHEQEITVWYSVPSALIHLVAHGEMGRFDFPRLRAILFAGEVFPVRHLRGLRRLVPHARLYNLYGPTETNVCTYYEIGEIPPDRVDPFPIGRACANTEVFAVGERGERIGPGEEGELFVRGSCLMKGYWGRPDKSAQAMVQNPFVKACEDKVYRTGDLVRLEPDGNYSFVGRKDQMIKSRGYRIELGEIEAALYAHPGVKEAAALAVPDDEVGNRIKALVVRSPGSDATISELRRFCSERLPRYMVPETIDFLATLPRTATGKVDRHLLASAAGREVGRPPGSDNTGS